MDQVAAKVLVGASACKAAPSLGKGTQIRVFARRTRPASGVAADDLPSHWGVLGHVQQGTFVQGPCLSCGHCAMATLSGGVQALSAVIRCDGIRVDLLAPSHTAIGTALQELRAAGHAAHVMGLAHRSGSANGMEDLVGLGILTARQLEVLRAAVAAGYFSAERQTSLRALADDLGCSAGTVHEHLRKGLAKVMDALFFAEGQSPATQPTWRRLPATEPAPAVAADPVW